MSEHLPPVGWSVARRQGQGARAYQEDDLRVVEPAFGEDSARPGVLLVLADGMGGEVGGAQASRLVVESFAHRFGQLQGTTDERLNACLDAASGALAAQVREDPELDGMGSTVVAVLYDGEGVSWLSVGDSPMWLFTGGRLTRLNADHSMAPVLDRMVEQGELSPEEALHDRRRHMLRSAVTGHPVERIDCEQRSFRLGRGEYLVVASDGLETLSFDHIERLLGKAKGNSEAAAQALMSAVEAADHPYQDNVTVLVLAGEEGGERRFPPGPELEAGTARRATGRIPYLPGAARVIVPALLVVGLLVVIGLILWETLEPEKSAVESSPDVTSQKVPPGENVSDFKEVDDPGAAESTVPGKKTVEPTPQPAGKGSPEAEEASPASQATRDTEVPAAATAPAPDPLPQTPPDGESQGQKNESDSMPPSDPAAAGQTEPQNPEIDGEETPASQGKSAPDKPPAELAEQGGSAPGGMEDPPAGTPNAR